jgi:hypothetical protein
MRSASRFLVLSLLISACGDSGGDITEPTTGSIEVTTATAGETAATGYTVSLDGQASEVIGINARLTREGLSAGTHSVLLGALPEGCTVTGANPQNVTVTPSTTAAVSFVVACASTAPTTGGIRIVTSTTGTSPDTDGYTFSLDGAPAQPIVSNATIGIADQPVGSHTLLLAGMASNCSLTEENPRTFSVTAGSTIEVRFAITCVSLNALQWTRMESGSTAFLSDVWGSGPRDVYVTGEDTGPFGGVLLHYDGQSWSLVHRSAAGPLLGVWASAPNDVFAVGYEILHYDGIEWSTMAGPDLPGNAHYHAVWGTSSSNVYAVGDYFSDEADNLLIAHYDGSTWSVVDLGPRIAQIASNVHGTSATDVYVTGFLFKAPPYSAFALHYDGTSWSKVLIEQGLLYSIWANAPNDVFAGGVDGGVADEAGIIRHYDGQNWTETAVSTLRVLSLWGASASDVYAAGDGRVFHFDGNAWSRVFDEEVAAVWGSSATDVFMVGAGGLILHGTGDWISSVATGESRTRPRGLWLRVPDIRKGNRYEPVHKQTPAHRLP